MAKIRRNAPCPCGSGRKYKKCHGNPLQEQRVEANKRLQTIPAEVIDALRRHKAQEMIREQQQGLGKPIIGTEFAGHQIVAVGNTIYYSKGWKFFSDFLSDYIKMVMDSAWGNAEIAKPLAERHPILQWYDSYCRFQRSHSKNVDGVYSAPPTGVVYCYLGLAYSLYLLKHNVELQDRMIARLKNREQFQGAYYELIVANCLIRAGFELTLEDETDDKTKHCEFAAVSKRTQKKYWVEAKMRSVSGLLGKTDADGASPKAKPTSRLSTHLREALAKPAEDERLIFVDVNAPASIPSAGSSDKPEIPVWAEAAGRQLDDREKALKANESAYVFVTSMGFHRNLEGPVGGHVALAHGLGIADFAKVGPIRLSEAWRRKQKHIDAHAIGEALQSYPNIPNTFDGSIPLTKSAAENRIEIGKSYFFEDAGKNGMIGEVTSATISEQEKKVYIGVTGEDGQSRILTRQITDDELSAYKEHPDAYFGVVRKVSRTTETPQELFEWFVENHLKTPKSNLLAMCRDHPDIAALAKLDQPDLVLEVCERLTAIVMRRHRRTG